MEKPQVLLIDDDQDFSNAIKASFEKEGYSVAAAYDGEEGVRLAKKMTPDLVVLDVMMPKKDGYSVCHDIKSDDATSSIPVIMPPLAAIPYANRASKALPSSIQYRRNRQPFASCRSGCSFCRRSRAACSSVLWLIPFSSSATQAAGRTPPIADAKAHGTELPAESCQLPTGPQRCGRQSVPRSATGSPNRQKRKPCEKGRD